MIAKFLASVALIGSMFLAIGTAHAQVQIAATPGIPSIEGTYRGGNDLVGHGCSLGDDPCKVGMVMKFYQNSQDQTVVDFWTETGTATYRALKDGVPYANEARMKKQGIFPLKASGNGTFSFSYSIFIYDQCRIPSPGTIQCYFHKTEGVSANWVTLYKR